MNHGDRVLDVGSGGGTFLWNVDRSTNAYAYALELSASRARLTSRAVPATRVVRGDAIQAPFRPESFDFISCTQVIEHIAEREAFMACLYALLKPGGLLLVSSVGRAKRRLYYLRNEAGETVLESSHVHEFDSLDEFNELVAHSTSRVIHTVQYQVRFSIFDFILRRLHRVLKASATHTAATNRAMLLVRKATRIPIPGYSFVETIVEKNR